MIWNRGAQIARISPKSLSRAAQIARFVIWTSVQIAVRIAMSISYATSQNNELLWKGSHRLKSLVICDSWFESQIAIAIKSRDFEHLAPNRIGQNSREEIKEAAVSVEFSTGNPPKLGTFTAWNRTRNRARTPVGTVWANDKWRKARECSTFLVFPLICSSWADDA